MTKWYFQDGQGMLLSHDTREMYLEAKRRLGQYSLDSQGGDWAKAGERVMRDLSLLRSQMKSCACLARLHPARVRPEGLFLYIQRERHL
jgi:hypothetical protein